jgi:hypothetical protein
MARARRRSPTRPSGRHAHGRASRLRAAPRARPSPLGEGIGTSIGFLSQLELLVGARTILPRTVDGARLGRGEPCSGANPGADPSVSLRAVAPPRIQRNGQPGATHS